MAGVFLLLQGGGGCGQRLPTFCIDSRFGSRLKIELFNQFQHIAKNDRTLRG